MAAAQPPRQAHGPTDQLTEGAPRCLTEQAARVHGGPAHGRCHEEPARPVPLVEERVDQPDERHDLTGIAEHPRGLQSEEPPEGVPDQPVGPVRLLGADESHRLRGHRLDRVAGCWIRRERQCDHAWVALEPLGQGCELVGGAPGAGEEEQGAVATGTQRLSRQAAHRTRS